MIVCLKILNNCRAPSTDMNFRLAIRMPFAPGPSGVYYDAAIRSLLEGLCCKSRFTLVLKNSKGYWRGFRINM
jgi:hypothetical protein